jgi:sugar porter (SP) family MFS transporter
MCPSNAQGSDNVHRHTWLYAIVVALGGLLFGYDTSVISGAILFVRQYFHWGSFATELAVSIVLAGALSGAAVGGFLSDRFGRKRIQIGNATVFGVFAVLTGIANTATLFVIGRFMVGVAVGITSMVTPLYIAEISPPAIRGAMVQLNQLMISVGVAVAYAVAWLLSKNGNWRLMFISAVFPSAILLISLFFLPESPRWLAAKGHFEAARAILNRVYGPAETERAMTEFASIIQAHQVTIYDLFMRNLRRPLLAGTGLAIFQQVTGANTIIYYTPIVLLMAGVKSASNAILTTFVIGSMSAFFAVGAMPLLDRVGRRRLLLISASGMFACLALIGYYFGAPKVAPLLVVGAFLAYLAFFQVGLGPVFWLLISEIYPTRIRGQAMSVASVTVWAADWAVAFSFLTLIDHLGARGSFWLYAVACVAAYIFILRYIPETKGRTLEEIEAGWNTQKTHVQDYQQPSFGCKP